MLDFIMEWLAGLLESVLGLLPDSPFANIGVNLAPYQNIMGMINYVIPVGTILNILTIYLAAILVWYGVRWVMRFVRYID